MSIRLMGVLAAVSIAAAVADPGAAKPGNTPVTPASQTRFVWLDQNWSDPVRADYHHASQGTLTLPFDRKWILALEQPGDGGGMFTDPTYLERFGFIPSPRGASNPDALPIGFARTSGTDPRNGRQIDRLGFTCAACHTGRLDHQGTAILIDGGPALIDVNSFGSSLALSFAATWIKSGRFDRFADRVLGPEAGKAARDRLRKDMRNVLVAQGWDLARGKFVALFSTRPKSVAEGPGRLDALNRIGNTVFGDMSRRNNRPTTAPVAYPHIWDTHWFSWVQYNGSIEQPMVRNAGEAMGVSAAVNYKDPPPQRFLSTIPFRHLDQRIEQQLRGPQTPQHSTGFTGLTSPRWPAHILGAIDTQLRDEGAVLYARNCQSCHMPDPRTEAFWTDRRWTQPNSAGERYIDLSMVNIERDPARPNERWVGTDPAQARDMANREVRVPLDFGIDQGMLRGRAGRFGIYPYGDALGEVVEMTVNRGYDAEGVPQADRARMNGNRPNGIRARMQYKARPLNGIWATGPFLHNGSVRTLWDLLSPYAERPCSFRVGTREFDTRDIGFANGEGWTLVACKDDAQRTQLPGNSNLGHLFDIPTTQNRGRGILGSPFSVRERRALIEYLKTL